MNNQQGGFFFEIQQISDNSVIFDEFKKQELFFFYFQVYQKYYLFFYGQKFIDIIEELDRKQRKIRSLRDFFLYPLETMENGKDLEILTTNLQPSFWRKLKTILRQNKKIVLLEFLFGSQDSIAAPETQNHWNEKFETLQNQANFLQQKIIDLEAKLENSRYALRGTLEAPDGTKIIQQGDF
jgi:hypothetical protein